MTRSQIFRTIEATATRILFARDSQPSRTRAYAMAARRGEQIAMRNMRALDERPAPCPAWCTLPPDHRGFCDSSALGESLGGCP